MTYDTHLRHSTDLLRLETFDLQNRFAIRDLKKKLFRKNMSNKKDIMFEFGRIKNEVIRKT